MVTDVGVCKDAINVYGNHLSESKTDSLMINFIRKILNVKKPDLVILAGD